MSQTANISNFVFRQAQLLEDVSRVWQHLVGIEAHLWLPGVRMRFSGPLRRLGAIRPLRVGLEVTENGGLVFHGAISRPKHGKLMFDTIFRYDLTQPFREHARGDVLTLKNEVLVNRALGLLTDLVRFGERRRVSSKIFRASKPKWPQFLVPFNPGEEQYDADKLDSLTAGMLPELVAAYRDKLKDSLTDRTSITGTVLVDSAIVPDRYVAAALERELGYETYAAVLGRAHWNPARGLREQQNPAVELLAKHGITDLNALSQDKLDQLVAEFRSLVLLDERLSDDDIYDALVNPTEPVVFETGFDGITPARLVAAMRKVAGASRAARDASDSDLLEAAHSGGPLVISCLSFTQICAVEDLQELPAPYAGGVLPPLDWQPPRLKAVVAA